MTERHSKGAIPPVRFEPSYGRPLPAAGRGLDDAGDGEGDVLPPRMGDDLDADREAFLGRPAADDDRRPAGEVVDVRIAVPEPVRVALAVADRRLWHRRADEDVEVREPPEQPGANLVRPLDETADLVARDGRAR